MSCPLGPDICIYRGDTYSTTFTVREDGVAKDITGYTIKFVVKKNTETVDKAIDTTASITDAPNGIAILNLTEVNTDLEEGVYYYDVEFRNADNSFVKTYRGKFEIKQDIA